MLKGKTVIRHYFRLADGKSISDYQFKLGETVLTATQYKDTELYFVEITGIKSSDLTTAYTVTVGDLTVTYSAMSYAYTALTAEGVFRRVRQRYACRNGQSFGQLRKRGKDILCGELRGENTMKKLYEKPRCLLISADLTDILTTSTVDRRDEDELPVLKIPRG